MSSLNRKRPRIVSTDRMGAKKSDDVVKSTGSKSSPKMKKGAAAKARKTISGDDSGVSMTARNTSPTDTIYLGHIPKGFGETEMRKFFSQFGDVVKLKLFRSKKTKGSKGYAFIKFESVDTAKTVSEAMNGYFMGDRQLSSEVVPKWKVHKGMFLQPRKHKRGEEDSSIVEVDGDVDRDAKSALKASTALQRKQAKLKEMGIDFEFLDTLGGSNGNGADNKGSEGERSKAKKEKVANGASRKRKAVAESEEGPGVAKEVKVGIAATRSRRNK